MISDKLNYLKDTKSAIKNAINSKGVNVTNNTPFRDYANKINLIEQGEGSGSTPIMFGNWARPIDRPPLPFNDIEEGSDIPDNTIWMLYGVTPNSNNRMYVGFNDNVRADTTAFVDWGDGIVEPLLKEQTSYSHKYNYNEITTPISSINNLEKYIWIKIWSDIAVNMDVYFSAASGGSSTYKTCPRVYEIYTKLPKAIMHNFFGSSTTQVKYSFLDVLYLYGLMKTPEATTWSFYNCTSLKAIKFPTNFNPKTINTFLNTDSPFNNELNINTSNTTSFSSFLGGLYCMSFPIKLDLTSYTTTSIGLTALPNVPTIRLYNIPNTLVAISIAGSGCEADALELLFLDLPDRSTLTSGKITIILCAGTPYLTPEQKAIATNKNWTIVES